jgi:isopenicillin N synthase-like dioxygenase
VSQIDRPTVSYREWADLPIIDFSEIHTNETALADKIGTACRDWGFFQLVNHDIPLEKVLAFREQGLKFFGMPTEVKNKMITDENFCQYRANHLDKSLGHTNLLWAESLAFKNGPVFNLDKLIQRVWPEGNPELRNVSLDFAVLCRN